jgi:hypothetical protein
MIWKAIITVTNFSVMFVHPGKNVLNNTKIVYGETFSGRGIYPALSFPKWARRALAPILLKRAPG